MKQQIKNLRDYAELAWASYFNLIHIDGQKANDFTMGTKRILKDEENIEKFEYYKALSKDYEDYFIYDNSLTFYPKLNGEFGEIQAQNFAKRYEIKLHRANTASGFSATLFGEKRKQIDSKTKEKSYTNEHGYINYILAIRGTESKESR